MKTLLQVSNLCKSYGDARILNDISFKVEEGEFVAIMGRSGSGKSTLLYNISAMDNPDSGEVLLCDENICTLHDDKISEIRLKRMGFIFQHSYLLTNLSVRDNIVLPGFKAKLLHREEINERADMLMEKTGIINVADHDIKKISGGQLQRAAICRALINQPDILFGDEPTGALNSSTSAEIMDIINDINLQGTGVIIVTHDIKSASRADRVIFLMDGMISDELMLGKYSDNEEDRADRERSLIKWLETHGF